MFILFFRQEKEREEMQRRQNRELNDLYKKLEQRRNDKLPKDSKRQGDSTSGSTKTLIAATQTITTTHEQQKSSNGPNIKTSLAKKQIHHSDEDIKRVQQRNMQLFEIEASQRKGGAGTMGAGTMGGGVMGAGTMGGGVMGGGVMGGGAMGSVWSTNKHAFNQMKGPPVTSAMVMKGPRVGVPTSSSSMPHIPQSGSVYVPHTSSSMVFANPQNNAMHGQMHTGVYAPAWTNGANQNWPTNVETGNGRGQPVAYPDTTRHVTDMNSWQTNGPYHPVATQPSQMTQASNPPRTDGQMPTDNSKHVVQPSR